MALTRKPSAVTQIDVVLSIISHLSLNVFQDFQQIHWQPPVIEDCRQLIRLAICEDLRQFYDWTTLALIDELATGSASIVAREDGIVAGVLAAELTLHEFNPQAVFSTKVQDGESVKKGQPLAIVSGQVRTLLAAERLMLNFLGRLSGIATLTSRFVEEVKSTQARLYDTRKTTPAWRLLEKYAVRCGGGNNHRSGLFDAILIKDNHLAFGNQRLDEPKNLSSFQPADAVRQARKFIAEMTTDNSSQKNQKTKLSCDKNMIIEIEVDSLQQLVDVLPAAPDIVLLDNMSNDQLREAVAYRDQNAKEVQLEASGGVTLESIRSIAETNVDRISVGALTHSATNFDVGLDWSF